MDLIASRLRDDIQRSRELVIFEIRKLYAQSALGLAWAVVEPLLFLGTYYFLFAVVMKVPYHGPGGAMGHLLQMFSGLVPWLFLSNCVSRGTTILKSHGPLVKQINFPIHILPYVTVGQVSVEFLISIAIMIIAASAIGLLTWSCLLLIPATILLAMFLVAISFIISCYNILLPDIGRVLPTILRIGIFITPVFYLPSQLPESVRFTAVINPIAYFISPFRYAFTPDPAVFVFSMQMDLLICLGVTLAAMAVAYWHRSYVRRVVVDYL